MESGDDNDARDDVDWDNIDWDAPPSLRQRVRWAVAGAWRALLVLLRLRERERTPIEKLCYLMVLNARAKQARWAEIAARTKAEDSIVEVMYGIDGESLREMTPPRPLLESIADFFEDWCHVAEDFAEAPTYRGTAVLRVGEEFFQVGVRVRRPMDEPSSIFLQFYDGAPRLDDDDDDDDDLPEGGDSHRISGFGSA